jgi:PAS domain S-box-containing protein
LAELDLLRTAIDAASILIIAVAGDGRICAISPAVARLTGLSEDTACGRPISELPALQAERALVAGRFAPHQPGPSSLAFHLLDREGGRRLIHWNIRTMRAADECSSVALLVGMESPEQVHLRKVQDQLLINEQAARIETEVANARLLLLVEGSKRLSRTVHAKDTFETLAEVVLPGLADWSYVIHRGEGGAPAVVAAAHGDPNKRHLLRRLHGSEIDPMAPQGPSCVFRTGEVGSYEGITTEQLSPVRWSLVGTRDPEELYLLREMGMKSLLCVPIPGRGQVDAVLMLVSASDPHRYASDDVVLARDLCGRAAISLENGRLLSEALDSVRARDDFLAVAAHELRTPLTSLLLQVQILAKALDRRRFEPMSARRSITTTENQARRLATLIDGLLDVARLASNRMTIHVEEVDLRQVLNELATTLAPDLEKAGCAMAVSAPDHIIGRWDRMRIEQVLTNLLSNAIKFGAGHPIEVEVATTPSSVRVSVRDQGIGISTEDQARIFDRFERAVSSRHFGGLGLGLYISVQILRAHRGSLRVESTPGRGACFIVDLPPNCDNFPTMTAQSVAPALH